jgi:haloacetate dehalogenase
MCALGHDRFALVGHDRGTYVALRLALDHPDVVGRLAALDSFPISEHLSRANAEFATRWWHWFFFAQPKIPELVINADPDSWYHGDPEAMGPANYEEWREAMRNPEVVTAMWRTTGLASQLIGDMKRPTELPVSRCGAHFWSYGRCAMTWRTSMVIRS